MSQINPLTSSLAGTPMAQALAAAERDAEVREKQRALKNARDTDKDDGIYVDSTNRADAVDDDTRRDSTPERERKRRKPKDGDADEPPHIDIQA